MTGSSDLHTGQVGETKRLDQRIETLAMGKTRDGPDKIFSRRDAQRFAQRGYFARAQPPMRSEQLIELEHLPTVCGRYLPPLPMRIAYEPVEFKEMRAIGPVMQSRHRRRLCVRTRNDAR